MYRRIVRVFAVFFIVVLSFVYAGESNSDSIKTANPEVSYGTDDNAAKSDKQNYVQNYSGLLYKPLTIDIKPQNAGFIRLKPRPSKNGEEDGQVVYDIVFSENEPSGKKGDAGPADKPYVAVEKVENIDNSHLIKKETAKEHKAEVSLGYKLSPFSEIYLGKGFLVEGKDNNTLQPHDDGWRIKFKTNF